jgi:indolepyruvate ferredoxin oxidoreductase beta subunit
MKSNIIIAGVGGQGILTIAAVLDTAALDQNLYVKQSEVHGMSQRGGAVQSHVRISDSKIYSDLIPKGKADLILSVEPMELLRYVPYLKSKGWLITDSNTFINISDYPDKDDLYKNIKSHRNNIIINATEVAKKLGNSKVANIVLLGAASFLIPLSEESILTAIKKLFQNKSKRIINLNMEAFQIGKKIAKEYTDFAY